MITLPKYKGILPVVLCCVFVLILVIVPSALFVPNHYAATKQDHKNTSHIDYITNQTHKTDLTPTVMTGLHVPFIKNEGQSDSKVKFYANTFAGTVFVTNDGLTYSIPDPSTTKDGKFSAMNQNRTYSVIQENFENAKQLYPAGNQKSQTIVNYFLGNNKQDWRTNIPTYDGITLGTLWPGINLSLKAHGNNVEKIFTVNPGSSVQEIKINISGAKNLVTSNGQLLINTVKGAISMTKPLAYQEIDGARKAVDVSYTVFGTTYGFDIGSYDTTKPLVIDPLLASTFLGGGGGNAAYAIALDSSGNVYITGTALSGFPTTAGAYQTTSSANQAVFVSKFNSGLTSLLASTYIGPSAYNSIANAIAISSSGNVYVAGYTGSPNYPTTAGAYQTTFYGNGGTRNAIVSELNSGLSSLLGSTYLSGSTNTFDVAQGIAFDSSGNVYVVGEAQSTNFPVTNGAYQTTKSTVGGISASFISKFNSGLTTLIASTYLGGNYDNAEAHAVALDSSGDVYIAGRGGNGFPVTIGPSCIAKQASVSELNNGLSSLLASTCLTGSDADAANAIALDSSDNVYISGYTRSSSFPVTNGTYQTTYPVNNCSFCATAFVAKLSSGLSILAATYLGAGYEFGQGIALDNLNNVYVTGYTFKANFPTTPQAYQPTGQAGGANPFVSKLNSGLTTLLDSTYVSGSDSCCGNGQATGIVLDSSDNIYITGWTDAPSFPTTTGAYQTAFSGSHTFDIFASKIFFPTIVNHPIFHGSVFLAESVQVRDFMISFIPPPPPSITSITASNPQSSGYVKGAQITVKFSSRTNTPFEQTTNNVYQTADVDSLFSFSGVSSPCICTPGSTIGNTYNGTWLDRSTFLITTINPGTVTANNLLGNLKIQVKLTAGLRNAAGTSASSTSTSGVLSGSFGSPSPPLIKAFTVNDPNNGPNSFHAGDVFSIKFDQETNQIAGTTLDDTAIHNSFTFSPTLGSATFSGLWKTDDNLQITLVSINNANHAIIGTTTVTPTNTNNIENKARTSPITPVIASPVLGGSFGVFQVTQPVQSGDTFDTTTPDGNELQFTPSVATTVTVTQTTASTNTGQSGTAFSFIGSPEDYVAETDACVSGCTISFTVSKADAAAAGYTSCTGLAILHDHNSDGDFKEADETLPTTCTVISSGDFQLTAHDSRLSKFAIGGVAVLALLGATGSEGNAPEPPSLSDGFANNEYPLTIDGNQFKLPNSANLIPTVALQNYKPVEIKLLASETGQGDDVEGVTLFTNLYGNDPTIANADTSIVYQNGSPLQIIDPHRFFKGANCTTSYVNGKFLFDFKIVFARPMPTSDMAIRMWDKSMYTSNAIIINATKVEGILSTASENYTTSKLVTTQILKPTQEQTVQIPSWIKNNAKWWHDGKLDDPMFLSGIQYLIENKIIEIPPTKPLKANHSQVPAWVKNDAGWWADGSVSDNEFVKALEFLVSQRIIKI
jgi:hypothetical protein